MKWWWGTRPKQKPSKKSYIASIDTIVSQFYVFMLSLKEESLKYLDMILAAPVNGLNYVKWKGIMRLHLYIHIYFSKLCILPGLSRLREQFF